MNRTHLQKLSRARLRDARKLLENGQHDGAYYLTGLAIECALKACISKMTQRYDFPDKKTVNDSWSHDFGGLLKIAGLEALLSSKIVADAGFKSNWQTISKWDVNSRYQFRSLREARDFYSAATSRRTGIMPWIRENW